MTGADAGPTPGAAWVVGPITQTDLVRYQGASGDFNAVHHDGAGAAARGARVLAPGMYMAGLMATWVALSFPQRAVGTYGVKFTSPTFVGDTLVVSGAEEEAGVLTVSCENESGVLIAKATVIWACD